MEDFNVGGGEAVMVTKEKRFNLHALVKFLFFPDESRAREVIKGKFDIPTRLTP